MYYSLIKVEGIGARTTDTMKKAGITNTRHLLERAASRAGRKALAAQVGIDESQLLKFVNMCDLMRIKGIGEEFSELLEAAGVDTVKELAVRKPENLHKAIVEANAKRKMVRQLPALRQCEGWVAQAKSLPPMVSY